MKALNFNSCLAKQIESFISLRRLSGTDYQSQARLLEYFDRFLVGQAIIEPRITRRIIDEYQQCLSQLASRTQQNRLCVVKQLCVYLARSDPLGYVPEPQRMIPSQAAHRPYIFSRVEVQVLLAAASSLTPPGSLRPDTYRTLLGLLYSTGIRIGEAFALNLQDFHRAEQRLFVAEGKFRKARWLPVSASTCRILQQYADKRLCIRPRSLDSPLFINLHSHRMHHCNVSQTFFELLRRCRIAHNKRAGPSLHDLRHTFAVHRLLAWYRDGHDVNARLPALATYMGHVDVSSTQVYLRPTAELLEQVNHRFHNHYLHNVSPHGGRL